MAVLDGIFGSEIAAIYISGTFPTVSRGGDENTPVARSIDHVCVFYGADIVLLVRRRVSHRSFLPKDVLVLVAWFGQSGYRAISKKGVSSPIIMRIILVEADTETFDSCIAATVIPIVFL